MLGKSRPLCVGSRKPRETPEARVRLTSGESTLENPECVATGTPHPRQRSTSPSFSVPSRLFRQCPGKVPPLMSHRWRNQRLTRSPKISLLSCAALLPPFCRDTRSTEVRCRAEAVYRHQRRPCSPHASSTAPSFTTPVSVTALVRRRFYRWAGEDLHANCFHPISAPNFALVCWTCNPHSTNRRGKPGAAVRSSDRGSAGSFAERGSSFRGLRMITSRLRS